MSPTLRFVTLLTLGSLLLTSAYAQKAKKQDKLLEKAQQLLKGYTPPQEKNPPQTETPEQAWQKYYQEKSAPRKVKSAQSIVPSSSPLKNQYKHPARTEAVQKTFSNPSSRSTEADIKRNLSEHAQKELEAGHNEDWFLQQHGIKKSITFTEDEIQKRNPIQKTFQVSTNPEAPKPETSPRFKTITLDEARKEADKLDREDRIAKRRHYSKSIYSKTSTTAFLGGYVFKDSNRNGTWDA